MTEEDLFLKATELLSEADYNRAFSMFEELSENNYVPAMHFLAWMFEQGVGTEKNLDKAFQYWLVSAKHGNCVSQHAVGKCLQEGSGTQKNLVQAYYWLSASVKCVQDNPEQECGAEKDLKELHDQLTEQQLAEVDQLLQP